MITQNSTALYAEAYDTYRRSLAEALKFADPRFTHNAITARRMELIEEARKALLAKLPPEVSIPGTAQVAEPTPNARQKLAASFQPTTADEVAVQGREWDVARQLIAGGRSIEQVILSASEQRLIAIVANVELLPEAVQSVNPEAFIGEIQDLAIERLAALGHAGAAGVIRAEEGDQLALAWRRVLSEALEGAVSIPAMSELYRVDPTGAASITQSDEFVDSYKVDQEVVRLDRLAAQNGR